MSADPGGATFQPLRLSDPDRLGRHRVLGRLGAGGMGVVYLGDGPLGRVAVKLVRAELADDPEFRVRFQREIQACFRVSTSRTARLVDFELDADRPWLATEFVDAPDLGAYVRAHGPLTGSSQFSLAVGLAEALDAIHAVGLVHRDLKPSNVLWTPTGPKVIDFGIASAADARPLTEVGGLVGTPGWLSPEQAAGGEVTAATDLFTWGTLVAFGASGEPPFGTGPSAAVLARVLDGEPRLDEAQLVPDLLPAVRRALSRDPAQRPAAAALVAHLTEGAPLPDAGQPAPEGAAPDRPSSASVTPAVAVAPGTERLGPPVAETRMLRAGEGTPAAPWGPLRPHAGAAADDEPTSVTPPPRQRPAGQASRPAGQASRRTVVVGAVAAAVLVIGGIVGAVVALGGGGGGGDSGTDTQAAPSADAGSTDESDSGDTDAGDESDQSTEPSATIETGQQFSADSPWRLHLNDDIEGDDVGCVFTVTNLDTGDTYTASEVYGSPTYQVPETGTFTWAVSDPGCTAAGLPGTGERPLPYSADYGIGDTDAFTASGPVTVTVTDFDSSTDCGLSLHDAADGSEVATDTATPDNPTVVLDPAGRSSVYLAELYCSIDITEEDVSG